MNGHSSEPASRRDTVRTALFVDFDNVYITLHAADPRCADVFATDPLAWLHWLERGMATADSGPGELRRILLRRCYLNPTSFRRYRADFTRAGFRVADCPSLTRSGKSSTDIHLVMDILDALSHPTRYDEFVIFSGDADFTPVLQRLREHDRRTAILAIGATAAAYKACSDVVIDEEAFVENALGLPAALLQSAHLAMQRGAPVAEPELLHRIAAAVREATAQQGPILATELPTVYKRFPEFLKSNWLGYFSLRSLTEAVLAEDPSLVLVDGEPWRIEWRPLEGSDADADTGDQAAQPTHRRGGDDLAMFLRRVQERTGAPALLPTEHASVFEALAERLSSAGPKATAVAIGRAAAEDLAAQGLAIPKSNVTFILQTLAHAGHDVSALRGLSAAAIADRYRETLASALAESAGEQDEAEADLLDRWICRPTREHV